MNAANDPHDRDRLDRPSTAAYPEIAGWRRAAILRGRIMDNTHATDFDALFDLLCEVWAEYAQSH